jgi:hypothetical protein
MPCTCAVVDKRTKRIYGEIYQKEGLGDATDGKMAVNGGRYFRSFGPVPQENVTAFARIAAASTLTTTVVARSRKGTGRQLAGKRYQEGENPKMRGGYKLKICYWEPRRAAPAPL